MSRAELRRLNKTLEKKTKTYVMTQEQIDAIKEEAREEAVEKAFILMLALPLEVLISEDYWIKSAKKRMPKFIDQILSLYESYEAGVLTIEDLEKDLWEFGGVRLGK